MNFEFLKNLRGLGLIYENCANAEKLAVSMPVQSVFTSRKSAELLAKFIYLAAHHQKAEELSFVEILSDPTFRNYVHNRDMMDAFHYIRKSGNLAVHGDSQEASYDAISVLQDLHYITGESARILGLVRSYPDFDDNIPANPFAQYVDENLIDKKATEMFTAYVAEFNAQVERDKYVELSADELFDYTIEGNVEMHEYLEFKHRPKQAELINFVRDYLIKLYDLSFARSQLMSELTGNRAVVSFSCNIVIGSKIYPSTDGNLFFRALDEELPKADSFKIDLFCDGIVREFYNDDQGEDGNGRINMVQKDSVWTGAGMFDTLESYKRRNLFTYKLDVFYPDSGTFRYEKITNGKDIDVIGECSEDILEEPSAKEWWSFSLDLWADFDEEECPGVRQKLQSIVRENIPESEIGYCEDLWEDEPQYLCCGIQWNTNDLREVQSFLDKLNDVLLPIKDEVYAGGSGTWEIKDEFAVATWNWTDEGFRVLGCHF